MHETMVAQGLLEAITTEVGKQNSKPLRVKISCGMFNVINDELLSFAFEAIAKDTICQSVKITVEHKPLQGRCNSCGKDFVFEISESYVLHSSVDKGWL